MWAFPFLYAPVWIVPNMLPGVSQPRKITGRKESEPIMFDPIADMLTRIRNAAAVGKTWVDVPYSKPKAAIADVLTRHGYLTGYQVTDDDKPVVRVQLSEEDQPNPITELHRVSKPGRRVYTPAEDIPTVLRGRGMVILSTSSGIMSGAQARQQGVGGEIMCKVW
jgi:small subunit ribosomal protein S8